LEIIEYHIDVRNPSINRFYERFDDLEKDLKESFNYFRIQGRLGNQLLGLSDAHLVYKISGKRTVVDISQIIEEVGIPEWIKYTGTWNWLLLLTQPTGDSADIQAQEFNIASLKKFSEILEHKYFCGFKPSLYNLEKSGLFKKGSFPFPELQTGKTTITAICVRRGDYHENPHLGILPSKYYKRAIRKLDINLKTSRVEVFTDDVSGATQLLGSFVDTPLGFNFEESPLLALRDLSNCSTIIGANSTFAFLGCFFSDARTLMPEPFYLSDPKWHKELISSDQQTIRYTKIPKARYRYSVGLRKLRNLF
jgi:hypothetical protein